MMPKEKEIGQWVIYDHPKDHPDSFVVRRWGILDGKLIPDHECQLADSLEEARHIIPDGLVRIPRSIDDDLAIVETWL
jgi:hypothetical protein